MHTANSSARPESYCRSVHHSDVCVGIHPDQGSLESLMLWRCFTSHLLGFFSSENKWYITLIQCINLLLNLHRNLPQNLMCTSGEMSLQVGSMPPALTWMVVCRVEWCFRLHRKLGHRFPADHISQGFEVKGKSSVRVPSLSCDPFRLTETKVWVGLKHLGKEKGHYFKDTSVHILDWEHRNGLISKWNVENWRPSMSDEQRCWLTTPAINHLQCSLEIPFPALQIPHTGQKNETTNRCYQTNQD